MLTDLLRPDELDRIERDYPEGVSARVIVDIFKPRGVALSEATFRKYVQVGLLPRSRRVGRKGKHKGSQGVYPVESVRRINAIKQMMLQGHTLDEIRRSYMVVRNHMDTARREFDAVFDGLTEAIAQTEKAAEADRREWTNELTALRARVSTVIRDVTKLGSKMSSSRAATESGRSLW